MYLNHVYYNLRRDVQNYKEAWVFKVDNDEFVGTAKAVKAVAALYADKVSKEEFKEAMAIKKRNLKITKSYIKQTFEIPLDEQYENYKAAYDSANKDNKEMETFGRQDLSVFFGR